MNTDTSRSTLTRTLSLSHTYRRLGHAMMLEVEGNLTSSQAVQN
jgi:hypothetical protein